MPISSTNRVLEQLTSTWTCSNASNSKGKPNKITWVPASLSSFYVLPWKVTVDYKSLSELLLESETSREKGWGIPFVVSPTALLQALTISLCFADSWDSESLYFHLCRRYLHLVCVVQTGWSGVQHRRRNVTPDIPLRHWQSNPPSKQHRLPTFHAIKSQDPRAPLKGLGVFSRGFSGLQTGRWCCFNVNLECQLWLITASRSASACVRRLQVQRSAVRGGREQSLMYCLSLPGPNLFLCLSASYTTVVSSRNSRPTEITGRGEAWLTSFFLFIHLVHLFCKQLVNWKLQINQQFEETNAIKKILSPWQTIYFPSIKHLNCVFKNDHCFPATYNKNCMETSLPTTSAAFYKLHWAPLYPAYTFIHSTHLSMISLPLTSSCNAKIRNYLVEKGSAFLKIISRVYLAKLGIEGKNNRKLQSDSL